MLAPPPSPQGGGPKPKVSANDQYKQIETNLIACLKDLREKAESYASGTIAALTDTVDDIKSVIEQAKAKRDLQVP